MDPFDTLGMEPSFSLDIAQLSRRKRELSAQLHPDKFVGRAASERRQALGRAIEVNEAHRRLVDPLSRALVLLERLGLSEVEGKEAAAPPALLMEMMEARENLRGAGRAGDLAKVEALAGVMRARQQATFLELERGFAAALETRVSAESSEAKHLQQKVAELRYFQRFFDEVDAILDEL
jgi:molecular chaperone HscB